MDEIKTLLENSYIGHRSHAKAEYEFGTRELMRLIELVEEEQANYILDRVQDNYKEPTRWVIQQLIEK